MITAIEIRERVVDGVVVLYPGHYLNQLRGESIEYRCRELMAEGFRQVVINFEETEFINSVGISILLGIIETINESRGALALSNLNSASRELFDVLGLTPMLRIEETEQIAVERLRSLGR
jgi:anti-anti-sigma factor